MPRADVVVIGAGLAGLACAVELAERGASVFLAAKGMASTHWTHGGIDIAAPTGSRSARDGVERLAAMAAHPYSRMSGHVGDAIEAHRARLAGSAVALVGDLDTPLVPIPTPVGSLRPAAMLPTGQAASARAWAGDGLLLIGIRRFRDAWVEYAARNLAATEWPDGPRQIRAVEVDLPGLDRLNNLNARSLAVLFDEPAWRARAIRAIASAVPAGPWRIGVPAVLGVADHAAVHRELEDAIGHRVFEMQSLPPSVPGGRLFDELRAALLAHGGRIQVGFDVVEVERAGQTVTAIHTEAASRTLRLAADHFILATGGIAGEGIRAYRGHRLEERVFGLPVVGPEDGSWFSDDPMQPHPIESVGIAVDDRLRPIDAEGAPVLDNVQVIGSALAGMRYLEQRCGDGVALTSAHMAAQSLAERRAAA
ncbi:MAG: anaerobic glycerol-3-phosphate dehydrogenase subunit GlpB [Candidatus Limnocylindria bacterium]